MFFKKRKISESDIAKSNRLLIEENKKISDDIKYIDDQYESYVLSSLISDLDKYTEHLGDNRNNQFLTFWVEDIDYSAHDRLYLMRYESLKNRLYSSRLRISIAHNGLIDSRFMISSISINSGKTVELSNKKFKDIILAYLIRKKIYRSKSDLNDSKESFELLRNVIGKDVMRDTKIEEILGSDN